MPTTRFPPQVTPPFDRVHTGSRGSSDDIDILIRMLRTIRDTLRDIVQEKRELLAEDMRDAFPGPWVEVEQCFYLAIMQLEEHWQGLYPYLSAVGMTGEMLRFKYSLFQTHNNRFQDAVLDYPEKLGWARRTGKWLFDSINSILGSLTEVLPILEIPKQYKEHVEIAMDVMKSGDEHRA